MQRLTGDALRFWGEPSWREHRLRNILSAPNAAARGLALSTVDDAITSGMAALGFPRAPVRSLSLVLPQASGARGTKFATCDLQIGLPALRVALGPGGFPDEIVETWVHESVHGRLYPWGDGVHAERLFRGFEEGLAEGIALMVSRQAGFIPGVPAYGRYVQTYEALADLLGISTEAIYRRLFRSANGSVMDTFVSEVDRFRTATGMQPFTTEQRGRLERSARRLFDARLASQSATPRYRAQIRQTWRGALR